MNLENRAAHPHQEFPKSNPPPPPPPNPVFMYLENNVCEFFLMGINSKNI